MAKAKRPVVRAIQIAVPLTLLLVGIGLTIVVALSQRPVTPEVIVDFIAGMIVLSTFVFPLVFAGAWASQQWPGLLSGSMLWPTILLGALSLWWLFDDLRHGRAISLGDIAVVWMILWPIAVALSFARRLARAGGHAIVGAIREKWTERS
jgi:hypothetical protein